jgi:hypothetical protein
MFVAPVLVIADPARITIEDELPSDTNAGLTVCTGITCGLFEPGAGSLLLHDATKRTDAMAKADTKFIIFIFVVALLLPLRREV